MIESIRKLCLALPGTTEDVKWEDHLCFNVGEKMYLITSPDQVPVSASLKVTPDRFRSLCEHEGCSPAPYLARYHWIHVDKLERFTENEWKELLHEAYKLIFQKLPARVRKQISEQQADPE